MGIRKEKTPRPEGVPPERCGVTKKDHHACSDKCASRNHKCWNRAHFPNSTWGNGRCKHHGGLATGPKTEYGKAQVALNGIKHGAFASFEKWEAWRRSKYNEQEQLILDDIPTTPDLTPEIQSQRLKMEYLERSRIAAMEKAASFGMAVCLNANEPPEKHGLTRNKVTGELLYNSVSVNRWIELENYCRDTLRKILHTQKEINPGSNAKGNLHLQISITGEATRESNVDDVPRLADEADESPAVGAETVPGAVRSGNKDDDVPGDD